MHRTPFRIALFLATLLVAMSAQGQSKAPTFDRTGIDYPPTLYPRLLEEVLCDVKKKDELVEIPPFLLLKAFKKIGLLRDLQRGVLELKGAAPRLEWKHREGRDTYVVNISESNEIFLGLVELVESGQVPASFHDVTIEFYNRTYHPGAAVNFKLFLESEEGDYVDFHFQRKRDY